MKNIDKKALAVFINRIAAVALPLPILNLFYVAAKNNAGEDILSIIFVWLYMFVFSLGLPYFVVRAGLRVWRDNTKGFKFMRVFSMLGIGFLALVEIANIFSPDFACSETGMCGDRSYMLMWIHLAIFSFLFFVSYFRLKKV